MSEIRSIKEWREWAKECAYYALDFGDAPQELLRHEALLAAADELAKAAKVLGVDEVGKIVDDRVADILASFDYIDKGIGRRRRQSDDEDLVRCRDTAKWLKDYISRQTGSV